MYWSDGLHNYKHHYIVKKECNIEYKLVISGEVPTMNFDECLLSNFEGNKLPINLLYSGGIDSEFVLVMLKKLKIKFSVITMKLVYDNLILNTQDVYYSEKFCRHNGIKQKFIDLDLKKFYESGDYKNYITTYSIKSAYLASQFWLLTQTDGYNIIGGNYFWPHFEKENPVLSPMSYGSNFHQKFITDNNLYGIGNMLSHSYAINYILIQEHKKYVRKNQKIDANSIKTKVYDNLLGFKLERRNSSHGWEHRNTFDITKYDLKLKPTICSIKYDVNLQDLLETNISENYSRL